jgi:hypothetical protein
MASYLHLKTISECSTQFIGLDQLTKLRLWILAVNTFGTAPPIIGTAQLQAALSLAVC